MELLYQYQHKQVCEAQNNSWFVSRKQVFSIRNINPQRKKHEVFSIKWSVNS